MPTIEPPYRGDYGRFFKKEVREGHFGAVLKGHFGAVYNAHFLRMRNAQNLRAQPFS